MKTQENQVSQKVSRLALAAAFLISMASVTGVQAQSKKSTLLARNAAVEAKTEAYKPQTLQVAVYQVENTVAKFKVHFENATGEPVTIQIRNAANQVIHQEEVKSAKYIRKFDLEKMADGAYTFEISNKRENVTKEIQLQTLTARTMQINE